MRIEIFKAGTQTDSAGNSRDWTESDLDTIASSYDPQKHEAPVCIGHPKDNAPAWGWVKSVSREGKSLFAEIGDLVTEFSTMLEKKMFKKRSISLYPDLKLRHIAFLGAQPPAVKGLEDFKFAEADAGRPHTFMDWDSSWSFNSMGRLFQGLRDYFIEKTDAATADKFLPQFEIDNLKAVKADPDPMGYHETSTEDIDMDKVQELEQKLTTFSEQLGTATASIASLTTRATAAETRATAAEAQVATMLKEKKTGEFASFADRMIAAGKMLPAQKPGAIAIMETLSTGPELDFTEGAGATAKVVKKSPLAVYQETIEGSAPQITFGEMARKGVSAPAATDDKLSLLTDEKLKANEGMSYGEASRLVLLEHPELNVSVDL